MNAKPILSLTQLKNAGIASVAMGMILLFTSFRLISSPINYLTITALLIEFTGVGLLIAHYFKTEKKQLKPRLYMAGAMLIVVLAYYFAIARV